MSDKVDRLIQNFVQTLLLVLTFLLPACHLLGASAAPVVEDPESAAAAVARRDGPVEVDASGRWLPGLDASARFVAAPGAKLHVLALEANAGGAVVALAHDGTVTLGEQAVATGSGVVLVRLDPGGNPLAKTDLRMRAEEFVAMRMAEDGGVAVVGRGEKASTVTTLGPGSEAPTCRATTPLEVGAIAGLDVPVRERTVFIGNFEGPKPGVEPWQAYVQSAEGRRQIFGSDQPIRMWGVDASLDNWALVAGSFAGTLAVGGLPAIGSEVRAPFVAAVADNGHVAWLAPVYAPEPRATMEPVALAVENGVVHLGLATLAPSGAGTLLTARLEAMGRVAGSCELVSSSRAVETVAMSVSSAQTVVLANLRGDVRLAGKPIGTLAEPAAQLLLFGVGCTLLGRFAPRTGEQLVALKPVGEQIVVAVESPVAAELRWYRK